MHLQSTVLYCVSNTYYARTRTQHYTTLHYTTLHYTTLHYTTGMLYYTTHHSHATSL